MKLNPLFIILLLCSLNASAQMYESEKVNWTSLESLKAYLEHNIQLNLVRDKFPKEVSSHGKS